MYMPTTDEEWERHYINREELEGEVLPVTLPADVMDGYYFDPYGLTHQDLADFLVDMQSTEIPITQVDFGELLSSGCGISLGISAPGDSDDEEDEAGHAITLWAVEYDENGKLIKVWVTDSDDEAE